MPSRDSAGEYQARRDAGLECTWLPPLALRRDAAVEAGGAIQTHGGGLDPYRACLGLTAAAAARGAAIFEQSAARQVPGGPKTDRRCDRGRRDSGEGGDRHQPGRSRSAGPATASPSTPRLRCRHRAPSSSRAARAWAREKPHFVTRATRRTCFGGLTAASARSSVAVSSRPFRLVRSTRSSFSVLVN